MSGSCTAYTIIGVSIHHDDLYRTEVRNVDIHAECGDQSATVKFCSECGRPSGPEKIEEKVPVEGFDENGGEDMTGSIGGCDILYGGIGNNDHVFVAAHVSSMGNYDEPSLAKIDLGKCERKICAALHPIGLWHPERFGIWTLLSCG